MTQQRASEERLDELRRQAADGGRVDAPGVRAQGGPLPGYHGLPMVKPPAWTWEIPVYFFVGGMAGMSAVLGACALLAGRPVPFVRAAFWLAVAGSLVSAVLLVMDLGRPERFLNMMRVFKWRSPMSVGAWVLAAFGACSSAAVIVLEWFHRAGRDGADHPVLHAVVVAFGVAAALLGSIVATYTGVLLSATAIPAWYLHRAMLPVHFGVAAVGSAAAALQLLGSQQPELHVILLVAASVECVLGAWVELDRHGAADRALRTGPSGVLLRMAGVLTGPVSLALRLLGEPQASDWAFLVGAFASRHGWVEAGRACARDPAAVLEAQRLPQ